MSVDDSRRGGDGFTLIELMIVMVVLGILAGIVVFRVGPFADDARASTCATDIRTLLTANAAYMVRHGTDAPTVDALVAGGYLESMPRSGVTFADGHTNPTTAAGCSDLVAAPSTSSTTSSSSSSTTSSSTSSTSSTTSSSVPATLGLVAVGGTTLRSGTTDDWTVNVSVSVADGAGSPVAGALVSGAWSDGASGSSCTTGGAGSCSFSSAHTTSNPSIARTWNLSSVTKAGSSAGPNAVSALSCRRAGNPDGTRLCTAA